MIDPAQMSQSQSFTTEEMNRIKGVQQRHLDLQLAFGQIHVAEIQLEEQLDRLDETREQLEEELEKIESWKYETDQGFPTNHSATPNTVTPKEDIFNNKK